MEQVMKNCIPWERLQGEEGAAETKCYELTTTLHSPALLRGRRQKS